MRYFYPGKIGSSPQISLRHSNVRTGSECLLLMFSLAISVLSAYQGVLSPGLASPFLFLRCSASTDCQCRAPSATFPGPLLPRFTPPTVMAGSLTNAVPPHTLLTTVYESLQEYTNNTTTEKCDINLDCPITLFHYILSYRHLLSLA